MLISAAIRSPCVLAPLDPALARPHPRVSPIPPRRISRSLRSCGGRFPPPPFLAWKCAGNRQRLCRRALLVRRGPASFPGAGPERTVGRDPGQAGLPDARGGAVLPRRRRSSSALVLRGDGPGGGAGPQRD